MLTGHLFSFSLTVAILLAVLYLAYKWVLASENYHKINRGLLWSIYLLSFGLPLLPLTLDSVLNSPEPVDTTIEIGQIIVEEIEQSTESANIFVSTFYKVISIIYLVGVISTLLYFVSCWLRIRHLIKHGHRETIDGQQVIILDMPGYAPFSFGNNIVIPIEDFQNDTCRMIMLHELSHVRNLHWIDLIAAHLTCVFQWYNPAAWLMREEFKNIHEYQADAAVLSSGINIKDYQHLLIKKAVGARFPSLANSLNHSKLKKRITMMYNQKSSRSRMMRPLALLPALAAALWITQLPAIASVKEAAERIDVASDSKITEFSADSQMADFEVKESTASAEGVQTAGVVASVKTADPAETAAVAADDKTTDEPSKISEQMPEYPGGMKAMMNYVIENVHRPAGTDDISGRVVLQFVVEKDGSIGDTKVIRSLDPRLDAEAIRVVKSFPKWNPGIKDGVPVAVWYTIPISFTSVKDADVSSTKDVATSAKDADPKVITVSYGDKKLNVISTSSKVPENMTIYVDGQLYDGNLNDLSPSDIESITVNKTDDGSPRVLITLKKK